MNCHLQFSIFDDRGLQIVTKNYPLQHANTLKKKTVNTMLRVIILTQCQCCSIQKNLYKYQRITIKPVPASEKTKILQLAQRTDFFLSICFIISIGISLLLTIFLYKQFTATRKKNYFQVGHPPLYVTFSVRPSVRPSRTISQEPLIIFFGTHVQNDDISRCFFHFFEILKDRKWPNMTKKIWSLSVSQKLYLISLWFLVLMYKMIISLIIFFKFFKILIFRVFQRSINNKRKF